VVHDTTLGGKAKSFRWTIDGDCSVQIIRVFQTKAGPKENHRIVTKAELSSLDTYLNENEWVHLANNVEKLQNGIEKDGIGKFFYTELGWSEVDSQLASHFGTLFYRAGVWGLQWEKRGNKI
jgi:hypothetical protein